MDHFRREAAAKGGGAFTPDEEANFVQGVMSVALTRFRTEARGISKHYKHLGAAGLEIEAGFFDSFESRAFATKTGDVYVIGISTGLAVTICRLAKIIETKSAYANPLNEFNDGDRDVRFPVVFDVGNELYGDGDVEMPENTDVPVKAAQAAVNAMLFLFHHEMAHCWNGHWDHQHGPDRLPLENGEQADQDSVALELDADARANSWQFIQHICEHEFDGIDQVRDERLFKALFTHLISIAIVMRTVSGDPVAALKEYKRHPSMAHRFVWILRDVMAFIAVNFPQFEYNDIRRFVIETASIFEKFFAQAFVQAELPFFDIMFDGVAMPRFEQLRIRYRELVERLDPFKKGLALPMQGPSVAFIVPLSTNRAERGVEDLRSTRAPPLISERH